jgi:hypothetical protein
MNASIPAAVPTSRPEFFRNAGASIRRTFGIGTRTFGQRDKHTIIWPSGTLREHDATSPEPGTVALG